MLPDEIKVNFTLRPKLLLVSPLAALALFALFFLPWGAESAPAWVQAVGSIGAIGVAIWVADLGHRHERRRAAHAEAVESFRVAELAEQAVYECYLSMTRLREQVDTLLALRIAKINMVRLNQATEVLRAVLQHKLPAAGMVERVFSVLAHAGEVGVEASEWTVMNIPEDHDQFLSAHAAAVYCSYCAIYREYARCAGKAGKRVPDDPR